MIGLAVAGWMGGHDTKLSLLAHSAVQGVVLAILVLRGLRHQARLTAITLRPGWLLLTGFALIVLAGTALLKMPRAVVPGAELTWLDALFTSTSAVCVTGLTVVNTATFFTPTGQIIILALIQIGGLGIMTLTFFTAAILFQGLSLHDRLLLGEMIAEKRLAHVGETLRFIVIFTIIAEALGAVAIFFSLPGDHDAGERMFHAVFHSVSAFCNAGFSTFPNNLADQWVNEIGALQILVCALIILGGLGTLPAYDGLRFLKRRSPG
ncbi:potassium transporter TrkG [Verrucomicrobium spinosum]|uniref:potassium transporter TrkG n=1 Tax=Verrucomicrobium spinosum TaxID=2736 RepID=UPI00155D8BFF|nr:potassium transporter TrkG [Verrucomicrobium spinosum]